MSLLTKTTTYWKFDESSGNPVDSTAGARTLTNNGTIAFAAGIINNGGDLSTSNSSRYFSRADALGLTTGNFGFSFWLKINTAPAASTQTIVACTTNTGHLRLKIEYIDSGGTKFLRFNRSKPTIADQNVDYTVTLTVGTLYHVAMTYDGTDLRGYLDGAQVAIRTASGTGALQVNAINIGRNDNNSNYTSALIDEMAVVTGDYYTASDVTELYNGGAGLSYPFSSSFTPTPLMHMRLMASGMV